jgi:PadR family transcriptional regulator, regulatory protein PadR
MDFSQDLIKGSIVPAILALLRERPMYGYEMVKVVDARTGGKLQWRQGTLYPALHKLESDGLIQSQWREAGEAGRARKYYLITRSGRIELEKRAGEWQEFSTSVNRLLGTANG